MKRKLTLPEDVIAKKKIVFRVRYFFPEAVLKGAMDRPSSTMAESQAGTLAWLTDLGMV